MDNKAYFAPGLFNIYCMSCGRKYKSNEIRKRWDGMLVCNEDWEPRHPQDFVRGVKELSNMLPYMFDNDGSNAIDASGAACTLANSVGIAGVGVASCAVAGQLRSYQDGTSGGTPGIYPY